MIYLREALRIIGIILFLVTPGSLLLFAIFTIFKKWRRKDQVPQIEAVYA